jgi:hypothetical protein
MHVLQSCRVRGGARRRLIRTHLRVDGIRCTVIATGVQVIRACVRKCV